MFLFRDFTLSERREIRASLKQIYGVGWLKANKISDLIGFSNPFFSNNLNDYYISLILYLLKGFVLGDTRIKRVIDNNINNLVINNSYRGARHRMALPVRGQRTRTNSATQRRKRGLIDFDFDE
jgi:small subunit ribosomal protein S13